MTDNNSEGRTPSPQYHRKGNDSQSEPEQNSEEWAPPAPPAGADVLPAPTAPQVPPAPAAPQVPPAPPLPPVPPAPAAPQVPPAPVPPTPEEDFDTTLVTARGADHAPEPAPAPPAPVPLPAWPQAAQQAAPTWTDPAYAQQAPLQPTFEAPAILPPTKSRGWLKPALLIAIPLLVVGGAIGGLAIGGVWPFNGTGAATAEPTQTPTLTPSPEETLAPYALGAMVDLASTPAWELGDLPGYSETRGADKWSTWTLRTDANSGCSVSTIAGNPGSGAGVPSSFGKADELGASIQRLLPTVGKNTNAQVSETTPPSLTEVKTTDGDDIEFIQYELTVTNPDKKATSYFVLARTWEPIDALQMAYFSCPGATGLSASEQKLFLNSLTLRFDN